LGAFFSSSGYQLFSYYMVTYTILLYRVAMTSDIKAAAVPVKKVVGREYSPALGD
jgi:hypothetical protein